MERELVVSGETVYYCLERLSTRANPFNCARASDDVEDAVSMDRVIELARQCGLEAAAKKLHWGDLRATISSRPVLLILRNRNAVLALRNGDSVEEIVVADPFYEDGQEFFLTRDLLEPAWDGDAIISQPLPVRRKYKVALVPGLGLCAAALTIGLLFFDLNGAQKVVRYFVSVLQAGAPNHVTASPSTDAVAENSSDIRVPTPIQQPEDNRDIVSASLPAIVEAQSIAGDSATTGADVSSVASSALNAETRPGAAKSLIAEPEGEGATPRPEMLSPDAQESAIESQLAPKSPNLDSATDVARSSNENHAWPNVAAVPGVEPAEASAETRTARAEVDDLPSESPARNDASTRTRMPEKPPLSSTESAALIARGDALLSTGDVISARLFYERAADGGDGHAAVRMGETYDPAFLAQSRLDWVRSDALSAARWYLRALELGTPEGGTLFKAVVSANKSPLKNR